MTFADSDPKKVGGNFTDKMKFYREWFTTEIRLEAPYTITRLRKQATIDARIEAASNSADAQLMRFQDSFANDPESLGEYWAEICGTFTGRLGRLAKEYMSLADRHAVTTDPYVDTFATDSELRQHEDKIKQLEREKEATVKKVLLRRRTLAMRSLEGEQNDPNSVLPSQVISSMKKAVAMNSIWPSTSLANTLRRVTVE